MKLKLQHILFNQQNYSKINQSYEQEQEEDYKNWTNYSAIDTEKFRKYY